jgi:ribosomal protein L34
MRKDRVVLDVPRKASIIRRFVYKIALKYRALPNVELRFVMKQKVRNSNLKKRRVSGFLKRKSTKGGRKVLNRRRSRGRTATVFG